MKWLVAVVLAMNTDEPTVWVFLSPDGPEATPIFKQLEGRRVRTVLLVERYFGSREPSDAFLATVQAAGELRAFDEEGLRMARRLNIRRVPAVAVLRDDHAHVATGTKVNVPELLRCSR